MKEFLVYIVKQIVDNPKEIEVEERTDEEGRIILKIKADKEDIGRIIGKKGKIIKAIRNLIRVKAIKEKKMVFVEI